MVSWNAYDKILRYWEYDSVIKDQIKKGIVEVVEAPTHGEVGKVYYIPHDRYKETSQQLNSGLSTMHQLGEVVHH